MVDASQNIRSHADLGIIKHHFTVMVARFKIHKAQDHAGRPQVHGQAVAYLGAVLRGQVNQDAIAGNIFEDNSA